MYSRFNPLSPALSRREMGRKMDSDVVLFSATHTRALLENSRLTILAESQPTLSGENENRGIIANNITAMGSGQYGGGCRLG